MALADTARLVASLELQDKFSGPARGAERSLGNLDKKMGTLGQSGQRLGQGLTRAFSTIAKVGVGLAVGGIAVLTTSIKSGIDSLRELENVTVATNTVIESTQGVAGQTAEDVRKLAEKYEDLNATMDDKVIQSAQNMLLTFTNVREDAFEPALEAALNLNQAMGGGPEGLQGNIIRVGRALNDPVRGLNTLTRAGVQFSDEQKERIKRLQEEGDLYGAQQVILDELATQFGGQFAAAGQTAEGRFAKLGDTIETLQQKLAGPILPALDKIRDKLIAILGTDRAAQVAERIGEGIASIFSDENLERGSSLIGDLLDKFNEAGEGDISGKLATVSSSIGTIATTVGGLPWQAIGDAARLLGTGSKALLDAFLGLPPWVQTAVLTGWGLNKLTGGAVGTIVSELGKGLIKGILNMNAAVVNINAATVRGPGGPGLPGGGGRGGGRLPPLAPVAGPVGALLLPLALSGSDAPQTDPKAVQQVKLIEARDAGLLTDQQFQRLWAQAYGGSDISRLLETLTTQNREANTKRETQITSLRNLIPESQRTREEARASAERLRTSTDTIATRAREQVENTRRTTGAIERGESNRRAAAAADAERINSLRSAVGTSNATLAQIRAKRTSFNLTTNVQAFVTATLSASQVVSQAQAFAKQTFNGTLE